MDDLKTNFDVIKLRKLSTKLEKSNLRLAEDKERFARCFLDAIEDIGVAGFMRNQFDYSVEYNDYVVFCEEYCPFEKCSYNCFANYVEEDISAGEKQQISNHQFDCVRNGRAW